MTDEPLDGDEKAETDDAVSDGAEDAPIESELVESKPVESELVDRPAQSTPGVVVEAQVVAANVRKPIPRWIFAAAFVVLVVGGAVFGFDSWVRSSESSAFGDAHQRDTLDSWQGYLDWAEDQGAWTRGRTPLERHVAEATERKNERRANAATATSDWPALCAMLDEFDGDAPAYVAAQQALRERAQRVVERAISQLGAASVPPALRDPVEAALMELTQNAPCGMPARVRYSVSAAANVAHRETILSAAATAIDVALQPIVQSLSARNELLAFELSDSNQGEPVALEYSVNAEFVSGESVRISDGTSFAIPSLLVEVRVHGPSTEMVSQKIRYTLPARFAVDVFAESRTGKSPEELTAFAISRLVPHVPARVRQVTGLIPFVADGGVAAYSRCSAMEVIDHSMHVDSDTREYGTDRIEFSCEDTPEPYYEGCCEDEDLNAVGRPEIGYRLVVNERSLVSLSADGDHSPIVGLSGECGPASEELACGALGTVRAVLEPGVYTAYVGGMADEEAGPYELSASIQPIAAMEQACAAVTRELTPGVAQQGSTGSATDNFAGECGGAGAGEDTYRLQVGERSRVRCQIDGPGAVHIRSECADFESEVGCSMNNLRFIHDPGTLFVNVEGHKDVPNGEYELLCDVFPVTDEVEGDLCSAVQVAEVNVGEASPLLVDLMSAPVPSSSLCTSGEGPEAVYSFELSEEAYVQTTGAGLLVGFREECSRGTCSERTAARLSAGTHFLVARGRRDEDFLKRTINIETTAIAPICEAAVLLRAGVTGGAVGESADPVIFEAECSSSSRLRESVFRIRALHAMRVRLRADGVGLSIHEGCGGRSLTCAPSNVGSVEARLEPGEYSVVVRGAPGRSFQLETEIERL